MNYADYYDCDICNGNSVGMSLFVSGCPIHCEGCFNSNIWDFNSGKEWTPDVEEKFIKLAGRDYIKRITFVGGSPLCDHNITDVALIIQHLKHDYPDKQIWVYTGYTWESILNPSDNTEYSRYRREVIDFIDVLVDGPFIYDERDLTLAFRGSKNQRIIDVKKSLAENKVVLWDRDND